MTLGREPGDFRCHATSQVITPNKRRPRGIGVISLSCVVGCFADILRRQINLRPGGGVILPPPLWFFEDDSKTKGSSVTKFGIPFH